jgi:hypothetical protein
MNESDEVRHRYPSTAREVYAFADSVGAAALLDSISREVPDRLFFAIATMTENGPAIEQRS